MSYSGYGDADEEESLEQTLLVVREVSVYKIPPRTTSGAYKCGEWLQSDKIWSGRLRVVSLKDKCEIRLEDSNTGELFACCHVHPGQRDAAVETVSDSSRYFVLRLDDGRGKHAFIGLGFAERNDAFDFNVALSDHEKYVKREKDKDREEGDQEETIPHHGLDLRLKEGETMRINVNVKNKPSTGSGMLVSGANTNIASTGRMKAPLAPPPGGGRIRSPLPPPPNDTKVAKNSGSLRPIVAAPSASVPDRNTNSGKSRDPFADLSELKVGLPSSGKSGKDAPGSGRASGWAAF